MSHRGKPGRNSFLALLVLSFSLIPHPSALIPEVRAADYPTHPVRLLIPFAAGGGADAMGRIIAPRLTDSLGQTWVVDNRGGAGGNLAAEIVAKAAPDGYTVFLGFNTVLTVNPSLYNKLPFDVNRDLAPVTMLATAQYILVLHPSVPANSVKELVALARQKPGSLNYSSGGTGTPLHLSAALFAKLAGEVQLLFGSIAAAMPQVRAGKLKALATTGLKRSKVAPDLPTMNESGFPGFDVGSWYALLVPTGTPLNVVKILRDSAIKAMALPDVQEACARQGLDIETSTPQELAARIKRESAMWAGVIRDAGIDRVD